MAQPAIPLWSRKLDMLYLFFFVIHVPIMLSMPGCLFSRHRLLSAFRDLALTGNLMQWWIYILYIPPAFDPNS